MGKTLKRRVTFTVQYHNRKRVFTPVNKKAQAFAELADTDKLSSRHLKVIKELGFRVAESETLKAISL